MPASCLRQGREGPSETTGADARHRPAQARASARRSVAGLDMPPSCVPQGRKGPNETTGADVRHRLDQARRFAAAPWRELPGVQPPRTCFRLSIKRERQLAAPWRELARAATHSAFFKKRLTFPAGAPSNDCTEQTAGISGGRGRMLWSDWYARPSGATKTPLWT